MGTFVAPMGSAAVAIPAASRWSDRFAALVFVARLNMSGGGEVEKTTEPATRRGSSCERQNPGRIDEFIAGDWERATSEPPSELVGSSGQSSPPVPISALSFVRAAPGPQPHVLSHSERPSRTMPSPPPP